MAKVKTTPRAARKQAARHVPPTMVGPVGYGVLVDGKLLFQSRVHSACQRFVDKFGSGEIVTSAATKVSREKRDDRFGQYFGQYHVGSISKAGHVLWMYGDDLTLEEAEAVAANSRLDILAPGTMAPKSLPLPPRAAKRLTKLRSDASGAQPTMRKEWLVVDGPAVIYRGPSCGAAITLIEERGLPSSALFSSSAMIVELLRDMSHTAPTPVLKPFRVLDDAGKVIHETETKHGAAAFRVARGYGTVVKVQDDGTMKRVKLPPLPPR